MSGVSRVTGLRNSQGYMYGFDQGKRGAFEGCELVVLMNSKSILF
jgi:hypothetical protein